MFLVKLNLPNPLSLIVSYGQVTVILALVLVGFIGTSNQAHASRDGRNGFSGSPDTNGGATCVVCHATGQSLPTVVLSGPTVVDAGTTYDFSVTITGGPAGTAGVNISAGDSYGALSPINDELHLIGTELAHTRPKTFSGNRVAFSFRWTAPVFNTNVTLYAAANSSNNQLDLLGDGINSATLNITVENGQSLPPTPPPPSTADITLDLVASGLNKPTVITHAGDERLFVAEQSGLIRVIDANGNLLGSPFLDIRNKVDDSGTEMGLLGLAFHPNFAANGYFYVNYTRGTGESPDRTRIARFKVSSNPNIADANSEQVIMEFEQPFANHNGGALNFGPDGYLYIASGDGGGSGDPQNNAQNSHLLLGKMLRIDVNGPAGANDGPDCDISGNRNYRIPPSNTYDDGVDGLGCDEIYASGLRNPWKFSFDKQTGDLWIADVGQNNYDEINFIQSGAAGGLNLGWRCYEGDHSYNSSGCSGNYFFPAHEHPLTNGNCSVIGGYVYRGSVYQELTGHYFYTDFCNSAIQTLSGSPSNPVVSQVLPSGDISTPSSFGEDFSGELYIAGLNSGSLYKIRALSANQPPTITNPGNQSNSVGSTITPLPVAATDPDGDPLTFSASGLPAGLSINSSTGLISGTTPATSGNYTVTVTVRDGQPGGSASTSFGWAITGGGSQTQTFSSTGAVTIRDNNTASPYPASVNISGMSGAISKVIVKLNGLTHTFPADLDVLLVSPDGQKVMLMSDTGGGTDVNGITLTFDAAAAAALPQSTGITAGTYRPTNYTLGATADSFSAPAPTGPWPTDLTLFNGRSPNGTWNLFVLDDTEGDLGQIANGFSVTITTGASGDNTPPSINTKIPTAGAAGVAQGTSVTAVFSESMTAATISGSTFTLKGPGTTAVSATVAYNTGSFTASLKPNSSLAPNTMYTVTVKGGTSGVKDLAGNPLPGDVSWSFTTSANSAVTQTFSAPTAITIRDNNTGSPYPASVNVSGMSGAISKVIFKLNGLSHTYPADLDVLLVSPDGQKVMLMSDTGGETDVNGITVTFDATAKAALPQSTGITAGTYRPTDYTLGATADSFPAPAPTGPWPTDLTLFNGRSPNGTWNLFVRDDSAADLGKFANGFSLTITVQ